MFEEIYAEFTSLLSELVERINIDQYKDESGLFKSTSLFGDEDIEYIQSMESLVDFCNEHFINPNGSDNIAVINQMRKKGIKISLNQQVDDGWAVGVIHTEFGKIAYG